MKNSTFSVIILLQFFFTTLTSYTLSAQNCMPNVNSNGMYISGVAFNYDANNLSAQIYPSGANGYSSHLNNVIGALNYGTLSDIIVRLNNCTNRVNVKYNIRIFIDWNNDGNFDDNNEVAADYDAMMSENYCATAIQKFSISVPEICNQLRGNVLARIAFREGGEKASACGEYIGEVEDYYLSLNNKMNSISLPLRFVNIAAFKKENAVQVNWVIDLDQKAYQYVIERSNDGGKFNEIANLAVSGKASYEWSDVAPLNGNNFYRVKELNKGGEARYSNIVNVFVPGNKLINIYPTLLKNKMINLQLSNAPKGIYELNISSSNGNNVFQKKINHLGNNNLQTYYLPENTKPGVYYVSVTNQKDRFLSTIVIE